MAIYMLAELWAMAQNVLAQNLIAPLLEWMHLARMADSPTEIAGFFMISDCILTQERVATV